MELFIGATIVAVSAGTILGMLIASRHIDEECEMAYLAGHVDGYSKAVADSGEVIP
jgi:hypothetical protein